MLVGKERWRTGPPAPRRDWGTPGSTKGTPRIKPTPREPWPKKTSSPRPLWSKPADEARLTCGLLVTQLYETLGRHTWNTATLGWRHQGHPGQGPLHRTRVPRNHLRWSPVGHSDVDRGRGQGAHNTQSHSQVRQNTRGWGRAVPHKPPAPGVLQVHCHSCPGQAPAKQLHFCPGPMARALSGHSGHPLGDIQALSIAVAWPRASAHIPHAPRSLH